MVVWHVCTVKKLSRYLGSGVILPPVRAWDNIQQAERMSRHSGRRVILRLCFPNDTPVLEGHAGQARISRNYYKFVGL